MKKIVAIVLSIIVLFATASLGIATGLRAGYVEEWAKMKPLIPRGYVCFRATNIISLDGK